MVEGPCPNFQCSPLNEGGKINKSSMNEGVSLYLHGFTCIIYIYIHVHVHVFADFVSASVRISSINCMDIYGQHVAPI